MKGWSLFEGFSFVRSLKSRCLGFFIFFVFVGIWELKGREVVYKIVGDIIEWGFGVDGICVFFLNIYIFFILVKIISIWNIFKGMKF